MMSQSQVYLDHAATSPLHPEVLDAMLPYMKEQYGNPSSIHGFGRAARSAVNGARDAIAEVLGCSPQELIFTSGGTESDNLALFGVIGSSQKRIEECHIITSQAEHHAVLNTCGKLEELGAAVTYVPVDRYGQVQPEDVAAAIRPETILISLMYGNNEVGTLQPIEQIGRLARQSGIVFHVDAVQALGVTNFVLSELPIDLMSFSSHKIQGPLGVGALYVNRKTKLAPSLHGGSQERNRRAGTENVPAIIGFAKAVQIASAHRIENVARIHRLREHFIDILRDKLGADGFVVNGHPSADERLPHILNVSFPPLSSETLLMNLDLEGIAAASGSACSSGSLSPSHVLQAMGLADDIVTSAVRFSFGYGNVHESVTFAAERTATIVQRLRSKLK